MAQKLILAGSMREAHAFAKVAHFDRGSYRVVHRAAQIRSIRNAEVYLLSSFTTAVNRHSVLSALRMARNLEVLYVDFVDGEIVDPGQPEPDPRGEVTDEVLALAYRAHSIFEFMREDAEQADAVEAAAEQAQADAIDEADIAEIEETFDDDDERAPVNKRRTRCKDCGELFHSTNPAEAAEHEHAAPVLKVVDPAPAQNFFG